MKKHFIFYGTILCTVFLSSCGRAVDDSHNTLETEDTEQAGFFSENSLSEQLQEAPAYSATNVEEQLTLIAENASLWLGSSDGISYHYAITDLDQNGRLEIITSYKEGDNTPTTNQIYEVNAALDSLTPCETVPTDDNDDSLPNLAAASVPVYYDFEHNAYLYVFDDMVQINANETLESKQTLSLQNNELVSCVLATRSTVSADDSADTDITCTLETNAAYFESVPESEDSFWKDNAGDASSDEAADLSSDTESVTSLSNEDYETVADSILSSFTKKTASIHWMDYTASETSGMDMEAIYHILKQSYEGFLIQ